MIIEKGAVDEVFLLKNLGIQIDIASLIEHINNNENLYPIYECPTNKLLKLNKTDGINHETLSRISALRLEQPILVTKIDDHEWIIDGNHRLLKRHKLAKEITHYILLSGAQLDQFVSAFSLRLTKRIPPSVI